MKLCICDSERPRTVQYVRVVLVSVVPYIVGATSAVVVRVVWVDGLVLSTNVQLDRRLRVLRTKKLRVVVFMLNEVLMFSLVDFSNRRKLVDTARDRHGV